jgi:hypothetical protein
VSQHLRAAVVALAVAAGLLVPPPAHAERWAGSDVEADVEGWHYAPEPEPCGTYSDVDGTTNQNNDLTRVVVAHMRREIKLRAQFRDLDPALEQDITFHLQTNVRGWFLNVMRFRNLQTGRFRTMAFLAKEPNYPDPDDIDNECGAFGFVTTGLRCRVHPQVDLDADVIRASVPRSCLKDPRWVRVGAISSGWVPPADPPDGSYGGFHDEWGTRDELTSPWLPPFGPKVKRPPHASVGAPATQPGESRRFVVTPRLR